MRFSPPYFAGIVWVSSPSAFSGHASRQGSDRPDGLGEECAGAPDAARCRPDGRGPTPLPPAGDALARPPGGALPSGAEAGGGSGRRGGRGGPKRCFSPPTLLRRANVHPTLLIAGRQEAWRG